MARNYRDSSSGNVDETNAPAEKQSGTILRMGAGVTSTTDMVAINPSKSGIAAGVRLAGLTIDFSDATSRTGRYGIVGYGLNQSDLRDIVIFNPGLDGFHFKNFGNGTYPKDGVSYDVTMERTYVRAARANGYLWYTGNAVYWDMDRWTITDAYYHAYNIGSTRAGQQFGNYAFHLGVAGAAKIAWRISPLSMHLKWEL